MPERRRKVQERQVATMMGSQRNPNTGEHRTDIDAGPFAVQHKARRYVLLALEDWLEWHGPTEGAA